MCNIRELRLTIEASLPNKSERPNIYAESALNACHLHIDVLIFFTSSFLSSQWLHIMNGQWAISFHPFSYGFLWPFVCLLVVTRAIFLFDIIYCAS